MPTGAWKGRGKALRGGPEKKKGTKRKVECTRKGDMKEKV